MKPGSDEEKIVRALQYKEPCLVIENQKNVIHGIENYQVTKKFPFAIAQCNKFSS